MLLFSYQSIGVLQEIVHIHMYTKSLTSSVNSQDVQSMGADDHVLNTGSIFCYVDWRIFIWDIVVEVLVSS